ALARGLAAAALGALMFGVVVQNRGIRGCPELVGVELTCAAGPFAVALGSLALPAFDAERGLRLVLDVTATAAASRVAGLHFALAAAGASFGALLGILSALGTGQGVAASALLVGAAAASGVGFGMCSAACARVSEKSGELGGTGFAMRLLGLTALFLLLVSI